MRIIRNRILPFGKKYAAINLFGVFFVKREVNVNQRLITHESIHTQQMKEMLYIPFYLAYVIEWLFLCVKYGFDGHRAYLNISHEREAYAHDNDPAYLSRRRHFAQFRS